MIAVYRTNSLQHNEKRWLKGVMDSKLGLSLDQDLVLDVSVTESLGHKVILALGGSSRSILINQPLQSDISSRGLIESFADSVVITTWNLVEAMQDMTKTQEFLVDVLKAKIYAFGLGNRNTGYIDSVIMRGVDQTDDLFDVNNFERVLEVYEASLRT